MAAERGGQGGLRYQDCSLAELRKFLKHRTGRHPSVVTYSRQQLSQSATQFAFAARLRALDDTATFRFQDLPTELRLLIYGLLLERSDADSLKRLYPQILATSKIIYGEASPELNGRTNLRLAIEATAIKSHDCTTETVFRTGNCSTPLSKSSVVVPAYAVYNTLPHCISNVQDITLQVTLRADHSKHLLRPKLFAEQFNQVYQILAALAAVWKTSGTLRNLKVEFLDDTSDDSAPPSPPLHFTFPRAVEMGVGELKRIFSPLSGLTAGVIDATALPLAVTACIPTELDEATIHPFAAYATLTARVDEIVTRVRNAGLCCTQATSRGSKPCCICRLERQMAIVRRDVLSCRISSQRSEANLAMNAAEVGRTLESSKVRGLVAQAEERLQSMG